MRKQTSGTGRKVTGSEDLHARDYSSDTGGLFDESLRQLYDNGKVKGRDRSFHPRTCSTNPSTHRAENYVLEDVWEKSNVKASEEILKFSNNF